MEEDESEKRNEIKRKGALSTREKMEKLRERKKRKRVPKKQCLKL